MNGSEGPEINEQTVASLLAAVRDFQKEEDAREQGFNSRASGLTGFVGIVVTLAGGAANIAINEGIDGWAAIAAGIAFGLALLGLAFSIGAAVVKVLMPRQSSIIDIKTIERFPTWEYVSKEEVMVRGELLRGLVSTLALDRQRNSSKAAWLRLAYGGFLFGAGWLVIFGVILTFDAL